MASLQSANHLSTRIFAHIGLGLSWRRTLLLTLSLVAHLATVVYVLIAAHFSWDWLWGLLVLVINHLVLIWACLWPGSQLLGPNIIQLPPSAIAQNFIALTFDDGPDPIVTPRVLDMLDEVGAKASFFCVGKQARCYPEIIREITARGHSVENHSEHHLYLFSLLSPSRIQQEIATAQTHLQAITNQTPRFFRPVAGFSSLFLAPVLQRLHLRQVNWTRRAYDTQRSNAKWLLARLSQSLKAGDILLLHDGHAALTSDGTPVVLAVLPPLLAEIRRRGLQSVALPQVLAG